MLTKIERTTPVPVDQRFVADQVDLYAVHTGGSRRVAALVDYLWEELR